MTDTLTQTDLDAIREVIREELARAGLIVSQQTFSLVPPPVVQAANPTPGGWVPPSPVRPQS